ncbi:Piso0_004933 [Millerozyma farinosa CBS 7064]|uniref:Piso0_004933 protein n=1 Tax=Pichia sorbitophila (strain ATCC MYA-4447 / BCRC 22081 / CBS 7064 / NBRC 10061 / NRRL Y-12695) TaxID=559304 RepID=G8Y0U0_PICSO|nr:Piso0_004933 [Millerozyma farinosa CBS 7064]
MSAPKANSRLLAISELAKNRDTKIQDSRVQQGSSGFENSRSPDLGSGRKLEEAAKSASTHSSECSSPKNSNASDSCGSPHKDNKTGSKKASVGKDRSRLDEQIALLLNIPVESMGEDPFWPYSSETLNEVLRLKIEQEKSRQQSNKIEFGLVAIELLKLAESLHVSSELIPHLFISNTPVGELKHKLNELKHDGKDMTEKTAKFINSSYSHKTGFSLETSRSIRHKSHDEKLLPSFAEKAESLRNSSEALSPARSPNNRSPIIAPTRSSSYGSDTKSKESPNTSHEMTNPKASPGLSSTYSPPPTIVPPMYPLYHTPGPAYTAAPQTSTSRKNQADSPTSGNSLPPSSPFIQKYPSLMYPAYRGYQGPISQQAPYSYYQRPPPQSGMYSTGAPGTISPGYYPQNVPMHYPMTESEGAKSHKIHYKSDDEASPHPPTKKHKGASNPKTHGINFMITTPKNPPAKKYNKEK